MNFSEELEKIRQKIQDNSGIGHVPTMLGEKEYEHLCNNWGRDVGARMVEENQIYIVKELKL